MWENPPLRTSLGSPRRTARSFTAVYPNHVRSQAGSAADREEINGLLARWKDAWNAHDMAAFASVFHEDGAWILWTGDVWKGRRVIDEGHAAVHKTVFRNSTQRELLEKLTFVGPDAAVVGFCGVLTGDERAPKDVIRSRKVPGRDQAADRVESELRTNTRLQMFKWEIASDAGRGARPYRGNSVLIVERLAEAWVIVAGQAAAVPASK